MEQAVRPLSTANQPLAAVAEEDGSEVTLSRKQQRAVQEAAVQELSTGEQGMQGTVLQAQQDKDTLAETEPLTLPLVTAAEAAERAKLVATHPV